MTPKSIHLSKLLKLFQLSEGKLTSALRSELRIERDKMLGLKEGGGDFHGPFWADAKFHVRGLIDLRHQTIARIEASKQRKRLYPALAAGFLTWLDDLRRGTNRQVRWHETNAHNHYLVPELGLTVKVDNLLSLRVGEGSFRLVYPYFSEKPILAEKWARVALWAMIEAFPQYSLTDMEVLDVLRGHSFRGSRVSLKGDEETLFANRYAEIIEEWDELRAEYNLG